MFRFEKLEGRPFSIADSDYFVFHSPYNKVMQGFMFLSCWDYFSTFGMKTNMEVVDSQCKTFSILMTWINNDHLQGYNVSLHNFLLDVLQLVQKSFGRLYYNDFLRNPRF